MKWETGASIVTLNIDKDINHTMTSLQYLYNISGKVLLTWLLSKNFLFCDWQKNISFIYTELVQ